MNADLLKIRESRLFKDLPDRAFDRMISHIKIRLFSRGETILNFPEDRSFSRYFGYVVQGRVVFLGEKEKPIGMCLHDEFFVGAAFSMEQQPVRTLLSAHDQTMIVYVPKNIIEILADNSENFSEIVEDVFENIYERSDLILSDPKGKENFEAWLKGADAPDKTLSSWLLNLEQKRLKAVQARQKQKKEKFRLLYYWVFAFVIAALITLESVGRIYSASWTPSVHWLGDVGAFDKKANFNIWLGIIGLVLILLTNLHTFNKWAIRKLKWKINYKRSSHLHIICGLLGTLFVCFHTAGYFQGGNIAHLAVNALFIGLASGLIGQLISSRIPKTIGGEKMKLNGIRKEQEKLRKKAELLMDSDQFKNSAYLLGQSFSGGFWTNLFLSPFLFIRVYQVRRSLERAGLGRESARLGALFLKKELEINQKIRSLEIANIFFKRWMWIHVPIGYAIYLMAIAHVLLVYLQGLLKNFLNSPF